MCDASLGPEETRIRATRLRGDLDNIFSEVARNERAARIAHEQEVPALLDQASNMRKNFRRCSLRKRQPRLGFCLPSYSAGGQLRDVAQLLRRRRLLTRSLALFRFLLLNTAKASAPKSDILATNGLAPRPHRVRNRDREPYQWFREL